MKFLLQCRTAITRIASGRINDVDETHALHMVQLSKFLLEGYGREEMEQLVSYNPQESEYHFPTLFFNDLISYMTRRSRVGVTPVLRRKVC